MQDTFRGGADDHPRGSQALVRAEAYAVAPARLGYASVGYGAAPEEEEKLAVSFRRYAHLLGKHKWVIMGMILTSCVLGAIHTLLKTPLYAANVRIQIEREGAKIVESGTTSPTETGSADFLRTQYELLKSRAMAERVTSALYLYKDDSFFKPRDVSTLGLITGYFSRTPTSSQASKVATAADILMNAVTIKPVPGSRLVDIRYLDPNPQRAQIIANGYADAYIASNLNRRFEANAYAKTFLDDQIKQLQIRLQESEQALIDFAEKEGMVEVNDKASIAENSLAAANTAAGQLISERIKNEQLWRQVESTTAINLPQLLTNQVVDTLRGQRKALETEYQEKLENFKPSYPEMVQISNKIKEVDRQLGAEVKAIRNSLKAAYQSSLAQEVEMKARIEELRSEVIDLQKKGIRYNILKREVETNRNLYNSLLQRLKEVDIAGGVGANNIFIVDRAVAPNFPSEPSLSRALFLAFGFGLIIGIGFSLLLEMLDDRVRAPEEVEEISGLPTLGIIPRDESDMELSLVLKDPRSHVAEAYRSFATALQFSTDTGLPRSIAVTSAGAGEGKSTTAVAIARHFAQMGLKVLLIDADLRRPSLHIKLNLDNSIGLSNYLTGSSMPPDLVQRTDHPNLAFMASGPLPPNAADLLSGPRIYSLISLGSDVFNLIVFDSPPVLGLADAQLLSSASATTVFVVGAGDNRKGALRAALRRMSMARVTLLGTLVTKFDSKSVGYAYGQGYDYKYGYHMNDDEADRSTKTPQLARY
ncbi:GumC family protein [Rhodomicrobium vannielii]|uniref:GumC family protein n=1 Tax=Rhodomicrobium vannielii TaxID=1069 RepID=UPI001FEF2EF6|nr:polysaccharide biosynthesis tyrosine autokinase [Rhodomicrobium vannielii]